MKGNQISSFILIPVGMWPCLWLDSCGIKLHARKERSLRIKTFLVKQAFFRFYFMMSTPWLLFVSQKKGSIKWWNILASPFFSLYSTWSLKKISEKSFLDNSFSWALFKVFEIRMYSNLRGSPARGSGLRHFI